MKSLLILLGGAISFGLVIAINYGVFRLVCTHHNGNEFVRYLLRAGCS